MPDTPKRILVITSRFNDFITSALLRGAEGVFADASYGSGRVEYIHVPGCFELPVAAAKAARSGAYAAVVCLGAVIRGETSHYDFVAGEAARGIMSVSIETGVPVIFGVLTTDTIEQALSRCGIKGGNKGAEAAATALTMIKTMQQIPSPIFE